MPSASKASRSAAVPLAVATAWPLSARAAICVSMRVTNGPAEDTQPVRIHSLRYFSSLPRRSGSASGIDRSEDIALGPQQITIVLHPDDGTAQAVLDSDLGFPVKQLRRFRI